MSATKDTTVPGTNWLITLPRVITILTPVAAGILANLDAIKSLDLAIQLTLLIGTFGLAAILVLCYTYYVTKK